MHASATVIIPQHRHPELTRACLDSWHRHEPAHGPVIIVDDGSPPADLAPLRQFIEETPERGITLLTQPRRGVTAAWNLAARQARTEFLIFLNNDVLIHGPWVERLLQPLREGALLAGPELRREASLPQPVLDRLPTTLLFAGWCFAVRTETWQDLGGFDEQMTMYWSDTDFQSRLWEEHAIPPAARYHGHLPELPLQHLGHRTAHDPACLADRRRRWLADREVFRSRWESPPRPVVVSDSTDTALVLVQNGEHQRCSHSLNACTRTPHVG